VAINRLESVVSELREDVLPSFNPNVSKVQPRYTKYVQVALLGSGEYTPEINDWNHHLRQMNRAPPKCEHKSRQYVGHVLPEGPPPAMSAASPQASPPVAKQSPKPTAGTPPPPPEQAQTIDQSTVVKSQGKDRDGWVEAIEKELANLGGTIRHAKPQELEELGRLGVKPTPSRMVFVQKPTKKKARMVICGQFLDQFGETSVTNIDVAPLRALIAAGWRKDHVIAGMDVTAAFLHADMPKYRFLIIAPPAALVTMGIIPRGTYWVVEKALYGMKEAPRYWEEHRDGILRNLEIKVGKETYKLYRSQVHHSIWHVHKANHKPKRHDPVDLAQDPVPRLPIDRGPPIATIGVYVDDFLWAGPKWLMSAFHATIKTVFKIGDPEVLGEGGVFDADISRHHPRTRSFRRLSSPSSLLRVCALRPLYRRPC